MKAPTPGISPPPLAEALLTAFLNSPQASESLLGDLQEEFHENQECHSNRFAIFLYWHSTLSLLLRYGWERFVREPLERHLHPTPELHSLPDTGDPLMQTLFQDLRFALRWMFKSPGFSMVVVVTIALGIGANTAMFSVIQSVLLRPFAYDQPEELVYVWERNLEKGFEQFTVSPPTFRDWQQGTHVFRELAAYTRGQLTLTGDGEPARIDGGSVTAGFFDVLGTRPALGRTFLPEDEQPGAPKTVILSHELWQGRFGGNSEILSQTVQLNGETRQIIGILPREFPSRPTGAQLWVPLVFSEDDLSEDSRHSHWLVVVGRLKEGFGLKDAESDMQSLVAGNLDKLGQKMQGWDTLVVGLHEELVGSSRSGLMLLFGAVGLVLLISCANVANLFLVQASSRAREIAVRSALGAGRFRILRQLTTESVLLAGLGGLLGLGLAYGLLALLPWFGPPRLPRLSEVSLDGWVLLFTLGLSVSTGLIFGLAPAWSAAQSDLREALLDGSRGSESKGRARVRSSLVIAEVALVLILLLGGGLLLRSLLQLQDVEPGFRTEQVLTARLSLPRAVYPEESDIIAFYQRLNQRLNALPGVKEAGSISLLPFGPGDWTLTFEIDGRPNEVGKAPDASYRIVESNYFQALSVPLLQGRFFREHDRADAPAVALINRAMAEKFWPGESPIGHRIDIGDGVAELREIVGVVENYHQESLARKPSPEMYVHALQKPFRGRALVLHTELEPGALAASLRQVVREQDPELPLFDVQPMQQRLESSLASRLFGLRLLGFFSLIALAMTAVGLYGVLSYSVAQRTREFGIRGALGASPASILKMVFRQGLTLTLLGLALGSLGALALMRLISSMLYGVSSADPTTFLLVSLLVLVVASAAILIPARWAMRISPLEALRQD